MMVIGQIVREHRMAAVMTLHDINLGLRFAGATILCIPCAVSQVDGEPQPIP